jgi:xylulokinase
VSTAIARPQPGWAEIDFELCWKGVVAACRNALSTFPDASVAAPIKGIGLTSLAPSVAPLAADGKPLHAGIIYEDRRSTAQVERVLSHESQSNIVARTGMRVESGSTTLSSMQWLVEQRPEQVQACAYFGSLTTSLAYRLTGEFGIDWANAQLTGLFALDAPPRWLDDWCRQLGIPTEKLPPHMPSQARIGRVSASAAAALGIPAGVAVAMGGPDAQAAAVGAGLATPQAGLLSLGTTNVLTVCSAERKTDPRFYTRRHVLADRFLHVAPTLIGGTTLRWAATLLNLKSVDELVALAETSPPGAGGVVFLPYLLGERAPLWDSEARGAFYGLHLGTGRGDMARAVLEGVAFAVRNVLTHMEAHLGSRITPLKVTGGGAFPLVLQTLASVLGRKLYVVEGGESAAQGAALLALLAAETAGETRLADWQPLIERAYAPVETETALYARRFDVFRSLHPEFVPKNKALTN